ncbi:sugar phosphate isomerase/epimerase [Leclercia sp. W6]|nr:sugar phosphate isomerase/epimerase [Leclercia sp. W6]
MMGKDMITFSATLTCRYETLFSPFTPQDFEQGLAWLAQSGFDAAELCINDYEGMEVSWLKKRLDDYRLGCTTIATGQARKRDGLSLLSSDRAVVLRTQRRLAEHIDAAAQLSSHVTIGSLRATDRVLSKTEYMHALAEAMAPCVEQAKRCGVTLVLEALNRYEIAHLHSAADMMAFMSFCDAPENVGVLWDIFHANIEDRDFTDAIALLGSRLRHVHFADSNRAFPGYGHLPIDDIYLALKAANYQGAVSLECLCQPSTATLIEEAGPLIDRLRRL